MTEVTARVAAGVREEVREGGRLGEVTVTDKHAMNAAVVMTE